MLYDTEAMKKDFTMEEVASIFGIPINHSGKSTFIRCPVHYKMQGKYDNKMTNCQLSKNHFYCHACNGRGDMFVMVQNYKKDYENEVIGFESICKEIADKSDTPELYLLSKKKIDEKKTEPTLRLPLSKEELELIDLRDAFKPTLIPKTITDAKPKNNYNVIADGENYLICEPVQYSIKDLYQDDPDVFKELVCQKAKDKKEQIEAYLSSTSLIKVMFRDNTDGIMKSLSKMLVSVNEIIERFSTDEEKIKIKEENQQNLYNSMFTVSSKPNKNGLF